MVTAEEMKLLSVSGRSCSLAISKDVHFTFFTRHSVQLPMLMHRFDAFVEEMVVFSDKKLYPFESFKQLLMSTRILRQYLERY